MVLMYSILFYEITNQMQLYAVNFIPLLGSLYMFRVFYTPIIRSTMVLMYSCNIVPSCWLNYWRSDRHKHNARMLYVRLLFYYMFRPFIRPL